MEFYAHSIEGKPVEEWHKLEERKGSVPDLRTERSGVVESGLSPAMRNATSFAAKFGCGEWGYLAGLWPDMGKYSIEFQVMLTNLLEDRIFHELHCAN